MASTTKSPLRPVASRRHGLALMLVAAGVIAPMRSAPKAERAGSPQDYLSYTGFALPADPVLPSREVHPSLWFVQGDRARLQQLRTVDAFARSRWRQIEQLAELANPLPAAPATPVPLTKLDESIHRYYGRMSMMARAQALVAFLEDDPAVRERHLTRAKELLLRAYDGPIFLLDSRVTSSPVDEIYRGTWLQDYVDAYDSIQPSLSAAEDAEIRRRLALEAQCIYENLYAWTPTSPHNHLSKPAWGLGSAALALSADSRARHWLARALEATNRNTRYFFAADGNYREGSHYNIFSLTNYVPFLYNYRNVSGVDGFRVFQPAFEYMVEVRNSRGWMPNIGDSYIRPTPTHLIAAAYRGVATPLSSSAPLSEILTWSYQNAELAPFEAERKANGVNYTGASLDYPLEIDEFLTHDPVIKATAPDCAPSAFLPSGDTVLRGDWQTRGEAERYLLFHGVASADNHGHPDHLSFILEAAGQMMASDGGYARGNYHDTSRLGWYATAPAHNTVTVDGEAAGDIAPNRTPASLFRFAGPELAVERKEAVFPGGARWQRTIAMVHRDYFVVVDQIQAKRPAHLASYLHGGRGSLANTGRSWIWSFADDPYGCAATLEATIAAPGAIVTQGDGEVTYVKGDFHSYPYLKVGVQAQTAAWITILRPAGGKAGGDFAVETLAPASGAGIVVRHGGRTLVVLARAVSGADAAVAGIETDASLALVETDPAGKVSLQCAMAATHLTAAGRSLWRSPQPESRARCD